MKLSVCCLAVFLVLLSIVCLSGCGSGNDTWTNTGGKVSNFGAGPLVYDSAHNVLYAGCKQQVEDTGSTAGRGVWKYDGKSWTDTGGSVSSYEIGCLAYDSTHNLLYASCYKMSPGELCLEPHGTGVWKYNGKTWTNTGGRAKSFNVVALAYDSAHNVLYAACEYSPSTGGVWKYDGKSWTDTGVDSSNYGIVSLAYDGEHNLLYAGAGAGVEDINHFGHSVWKYDGTNWTDTGGVVSIYSVNSLACDSAHNMIYACYHFHDVGGSKGVWKYNGTTWTNISDEEMSNYNFRSLVYDSKSNLLFAGCSDDINNDKGVWKYKGR